MSKKKFLETADPFSTNTPAELSVHDVDQQLFGKLQNVDAGKQVARPVSIFEITPDPKQPRRAMPSLLREHWDGDAKSLPQLFHFWLEAIQQERPSGLPFELSAVFHVNAEETEEPDAAQIDPNVGPMESAFLRVAQLAASIRRDGLTNPITIAPRGANQYSLETGERRWLSYHLLYLVFADDPAEREKWQKIPAREVTGINVWRQASENNARANLNAISKTRQYAILLMDLLAQEKGVAFQPFDDFDGDRAYYAQVVNAPSVYGKSDLLLNALGVSHRSALSRYRKLLTLPDEVWLIADDFDLPEEMLLRLADMTPEDAITAVQRIVAGRNISSGKRAATPTANGIDHAPGTKRYFADVARLVTRANPGRVDESRAALQKLQELKAWVEEQERRISGFLD
jgi:hypothetical protein